MGFYTVDFSIASCRYGERKCLLQARDFDNRPARLLTAYPVSPPPLLSLPTARYEKTAENTSQRAVRLAPGGLITSSSKSGRVFLHSIPNYVYVGGASANNGVNG